MRPRFEPANHGQHARAKDRLVLELWNVRQDRITIAIEILSQTMFGDMDRQV
jgi:hypothetical protein